MPQPLTASFSPFPNRRFHPLTPPRLIHNEKEMQIKKTAHNSVSVRIGGKGVEPPVSGNLGLASVVGGIKVRLGEVSLI